MPHGERGDIVLGWVTKIIVTLSLTAVVLFDAISVGVCHLNATDDANNAAVAAADAWGPEHDAQAALLAAQQSIAGHSDETLVSGSFSISPTGEVTLEVRKVAKTAFMHYIGPLKKLTVVVASGEGQWTGS